jgi:hypothetical protein
MRPNILQVGGTLYWTILTRDPDTMLLKDADSDPTVAVRKNGASVGDSVTVTKRSATTGIYDCEYNPAGEVEGDQYTLEESATVTGTTTGSETYNFAWTARAVAVERGTDGAYTGTPPTVVAISSQVASDLAAAHGAGSWSTATGFATITNVSDAQTAILAKLPESGRASSIDPDNAGIREAAVNAGFAAREWLD